MDITQILQKNQLTQTDLIHLLMIDHESDYKILEQHASRIQKKHFDDTVHYRGLIEFSNICIKNCLYCGIRSENPNFIRYSMSKDEIFEVARWNYENQYGSITLQSGERQDQDFIDFVADILSEIKALSNYELGITLCCGEQTQKTYEKWFEAGADRYLLRIETSNPLLYEKIHPKDSLHAFQNRLDCLQNLKDIGYQLGTGVMIGLPGQTEVDLAHDILFFRDIRAHMIGMGPYIVHSETPLGGLADNSESIIRRRFQLGLNMIATTRIFLPDINIAATTALQALDPVGREKGVAAGANILMPITTHPKYRPNYQLYDNKPCIEDTSEECKQCLATRMLFSHRKVGLAQRGDSPRFYKEQKGAQ